MHRIRDNQENESFENVYAAWSNYSRSKHKRKDIRNYEEHLYENLNKILECLVDESWMPSDYTPKVIHGKKVRLIAKAPACDHVLEAAAILPYEKALYDYSSYRAPAVKPGMGTMAFYRILRNELYRHSQQEMYYYIALDVHHYFPSIDHSIMKEKIAQCVKPGKLQRVLYKVVDSYLQGAPLGIKVSQIFGQLYLADFDRLAMRFFDIYEDKEKLDYWTARYIEHRVVTASSPEDERDLSRGSLYLARKFRMYVADGVPTYLRFVDNILYRHEDKAVLHILKELTVMHLARDYHLTMNTDYNVRPTYMGIRICGYVFFHDHVEISKRNKREICRHVMSLQKKGFTEEQIRQKLSSLLGFAKHADTTNLFKTLGMEKSLGKIIKKKKAHVPFEGMHPEQKKRFSSVCSGLLNNVNGGGVQQPSLQIIIN